MSSDTCGIICKECKTEKRIKGPLITDDVTGEVLCGKCGLVLIEKSEDTSNESRSYNLEDYIGKTRTGPPTKLLLSDKGLATIIDFQNKDASGNQLTTELRSTFKRLRLWDGRSRPRWHDTSLRKAFLVLDVLKARLGIPEPVMEETAYIFRKALAKRLTTGRNSTALVCAALYAACRKTNTPRTLYDITKAANVSRKELSRNYRLLLKVLDLRFDPFGSSEFVTRIANVVGISERTRRDALRIISVVEDVEMSAGKNPLGLAATALYLSCMANGEKKTQNMIAKASGITAVTIRNICAALRKQLGEQIYN